MGACCSVGKGNGVSTFEDGEEWAQWEAHPSREHYSAGEDIGEGAFSKVVKAKHKVTNEEVALKVVHRLRPGVKPHHWEILHSEVDTLRALRHPNIINLKESYEDNNQLVMVLELLQGGELLEHLKSVKHYSEQKAAQLFRQIADAVYFMHEKGYLHRDLKPENVLFVQKPSESPKEAVTVKLIDMGMATKFNPSQPVRGAMGTAGFLAPECCHRIPHSPAMDIWSLGMLLFTMLTGRMPYSHSQIERLHYPEIPITKSPGVQSQRFLNLSKDAQELLLGMLQHDPIIRMTAREVMHHNWVVTEGLAKAPMTSEIEDRSSTDADTTKRERRGSGGEITMEIKREASRKSLKEINSSKSQRSFKRLVGQDGGMKAHRSKSRFELLNPADMEDDEDEEDDDVGLPIGNGKSFFGDAAKEKAKKHSSRKMRTGKNNKIAAEP
mmetsp:Transcript_33989/g.60690  ORF Transcript_33989/g.60690 Transcript_33989/m.60690 type:complete len:439 (-) Transcript_33989:334-1650(-)|eukprot:CAMPEP_0177769012 /NCGR_PEP_ID=MMETSP0491_2-20121128/10067_1 /TAXON_ID=63592 /ORGANISM="Tetraselmis chuii, Strain PLY429" /LENGTH=438 /DNA_ID=CAMNT_0019285937 /DNA_START=287 /DNA_END=1603 /DNA_ORIENTATION=+